MASQIINESLLANIFNLSPIAIEIYDAQGIIIDVNKACLDLFGIISKDEITGFKLFEDPNIPKDKLDVLKRGESIRYEQVFDFKLVKQHDLYRTSRKDIIYLDVLITPIANAQNENLNYLAQIIDVTQRHQVQYNLQQEITRREILFDQSPDGILIIDPVSTRFLEFNTAAHEQLGYTREEFSKLSIKDVDAVETTEETTSRISNIIKKGFGEFETLQITKNREIRNVHVKAKLINLAGQLTYQCIWRDITDSKREAARREVNGRILESYHKHSDKKKLIAGIISIIKEYSECEAVGIRLHDGEDYPYFESIGFVNGHVKYENKLCALDSSGAIIRDSSGNPVLECMCGNIICGRYDPSLPFFTPKGSFWTNNTTKLLASTTEEDRQSRTRNRCNGEGYESVALIPIKGEDKNVGILQLNDHQPDRFSTDLISFYEDIAQAIGVSLLGKQNETLLIESERNYREIFNSTTEAIFIDDASTGKMIDVNDAMLKMYGFSSKEEVLSGDIGALSANIEPYTEREAQNHIKKTILEGPQTFEWLAKKKDGSCFWIELTLKKTEIGGKNTILGVGRDITIRKNIEENLKAKSEELDRYFNTSLDLLCIANLHGEFLRLNSQWEKVLGYKIEELEGRRFLEFIHPDDKESTLDALKNLQNHKEVLNFVNRYIRKDGTSRWIEWRSKAVGNTIHAVARDITESKKTELELKQYREHLEDLVNKRTKELNKINQNLSEVIQQKIEIENQLKQSLEKEKELHELKSRFISTASHEFRTPLTSILMSTGLIQRYYKKWDESKTDEHFDRVIHSVKNLTKLIDEVIILNRADAGKLTLLPETTDLKELIERNIEEINNATVGKFKIILKYKSRETCFLIDPKQIDIILQNLLSNAVKYSPDGSSIVVYVSSDNEKISLTISDQGIGIPNEDLPRLFEPFHRAKNVEEFQGSGLGLSIVKNAVELHKGEIKVDSTLGEGTKFTISIPLIKKHN